MMEEHTCMECGKTILVDSDGLWTDETAGMAAYREDYDEYLAGYLCLECAWHLAGMGDSNVCKGGIAGGGEFAPTFHFHE